MTGPRRGSPAPVADAVRQCVDFWAEPQEYKVPGRYGDGTVTVSPDDEATCDCLIFAQAGGCWHCRKALQFHLAQKAHDWRLATMPALSERKPMSAETRNRQAGMDF